MSPLGPQFTDLSYFLGAFSGRFMPALPYRLGDSSPPINPTSAAAAAVTNTSTTPTTTSINGSVQPQTPSNNPQHGSHHPHPYHHPHHHPQPQQQHLPYPQPPHLTMENQNHAGLTHLLPIRPQAHLPNPNPQGAASAAVLHHHHALQPPPHLHHPGLMGGPPLHLPPNSATTLHPLLGRNVSPPSTTSSPVLSPLRIRVNSPSRINSELLLDKSVSSTTPTSAAITPREDSPPVLHNHHHHHHHRNTNSSSPITTSVVGVKITASQGGTTTLHRPFSPSPKLKDVSSWYG